MVYSPLLQQVRLRYNRLWYRQPPPLPPQEARSAIGRAASVFVLYATSTANGLAQTNKRKTLTGLDVLEAMKEMEFTQFVVSLTDSLDGKGRI